VVMSTSRMSGPPKQRLDTNCAGTATSSSSRPSEKAADRPALTERHPHAPFDVDCQAVGPTEARRLQQAVGALEHGSNRLYAGKQRHESACPWRASRRAPRRGPPGAARSRRLVKVDNCSIIGRKGNGRMPLWPKLVLYCARVCLVRAAHRALSPVAGA
jgi:hypothetical protein